MFLKLYRNVFISGVGNLSEFTINVILSGSRTGHIGFLCLNMMFTYLSVMLRGGLMPLWGLRGPNAGRSTL
jgi:hypothetical protein